MQEPRVVIRKFILYTFAHATPEVTPFLVFDLSAGKISLPLTVLQLRAFDVGTETLPALALGREPAEPGLMHRPPRPRSEGVIRPPMLLRTWLFLGLFPFIVWGADELRRYLIRRRSGDLWHNPSEAARVQCTLEPWALG